MFSGWCWVRRRRAPISYLILQRAIILSDWERYLSILQSRTQGRSRQKSKAFSSTYQDYFSALYLSDVISTWGRTRSNPKSLKIRRSFIHLQRGKFKIIVMPPIFPYGFISRFGHLPLSQYGPRNMAKAYVAKLAHLCWHCHGSAQARCLQSTREEPNLNYKIVKRKMHNKVQRRMCSRNRISSDRVTLVGCMKALSAAENSNIFVTWLTIFCLPCHLHLNKVRNSVLCDRVAWKPSPPQSIWIFLSLDWQFSACLVKHPSKELRDKVQNRK